MEQKLRELSSAAETMSRATQHTEQHRGHLMAVATVLACLADAIRELHRPDIMSREQEPTP